MADIFDGYQPAEAWDEMFSGPGEPRPSYAGLISALQPMDPGELRFRADQLARVFTDRGVTFDLGGEERPFPLDLVPRVIDAVEWDLIVRGVRQRVYALEAFLADVYGERQVFKDGVVPWRVLLTSSGFHREVAGLAPPNGVRVQVAGIDLIRDEYGAAAGAGGQRPDPVRGQLRDREPAGHDPDVPRAVHRAAGAVGR